VPLIRLIRLVSYQQTSAQTWQEILTPAVNKQASVGYRGA
jgi:hypothetical protein